MRTTDKRDWSRLSQILDQVLDLRGNARHRFLVDLRAEHAELADQIDRLLVAHDRAAASGFLEGGITVDSPPGTGLAGHTIGPYRLARLLGSGGMGTVWLAHRDDGAFSGQVALKLVNLAVLDDRAQQRFAREGTILARLSHPHIARLFDAGVTALGQPYLVLEYVEGMPIDRYADEHTLDLRARLDLFLQVADAVAHAHAHLVVHRDLKPSNILVRPDGQVTLLDFGIATFLADEAGGAMLAATLTSPLTPEYAAPEQARLGAVTTATDVYALGVLLFRLLSGQHPTAQGATTGAEYLRSLERQPDRLTTALARVAADRATATRTAAARGTSIDRLERDCRGDLDWILNTALGQSPSERYVGVTAFADDVRRHLRHEPVTAQPPSWSYRARKLIMRRRFETVAAAATVASLAVGAGVALWQARDARRERDRAVRSLARSEAVTSFYHFLLTDAGPSGGGPAVDDLVARSDALITAEFSDDADHRAAILLIQAGYYLALDRVNEGEPRARQAMALLEHSPDGDLRAAAKCVHGFALSLAGNFEAGVREIDEGLAEPNLDLSTTVDCHSHRAHVARNMSDGVTAERHARLALAATRSGVHRTQRREAAALAELGYAQQLLGRMADADRSFASAVDGLVTIGQDQSPLAATVLNNWGIVMLYEGDTKSALNLWERAAAVAAVRRPTSPLPGYLLGNLGNANEQLGRFDEALARYTEATSTARAGGRPDIVAYGLNGQASVHLERGEVAQGETLLAEARTVVAALPPGTPVIAATEALSGRVAFARGRLDEAWKTFERLRHAYDAQPSNPGAARIRLWLSETALAQGRAADATRLAGEAVDRFTALQGGRLYSRGVGLGLIALAKARRAERRLSEADSAAASALEHMRNATGPEHPTARALVRFRRELGALR